MSPSSFDPTRDYDQEAKDARIDAPKNFEQFDHRAECPECGKVVGTVPAEGVPDQSYRACTACGAVFFEDLAPTNGWRHP